MYVHRRFLEGPHDTAEENTCGSAQVVPLAVSNK